MDEHLINHFVTQYSYSRCAMVGPEEAEMDAIPMTSTGQINAAADAADSNNCSDASDTQESERLPHAAASAATQDETISKEHEEQREYVAEFPSGTHVETDLAGPTVYGVAEALYDFSPQAEGDLQFNVSILS
jgi:hypothetical protein